MATIPYRLVDTQGNALNPVQTYLGHAFFVQWPNMSTGDVGQVWTSPVAADRSVQVEGTFGGATVTIQGSNEFDLTDHQVLSSANFETLRDPASANLTFAAAGLKQVLETTLGIRPSVAAGAGSGLNVSMCVRAIL